MQKNERTYNFSDRSIQVLPAPPKPQQLDYFDTKARGLGVRVSYGGRKSFFVMYSNRVGKRQRTSIGEYGRIEDGKLPLAQARKLAKAKLGEIAKGKDPAAEARIIRRAATIGTIATDFIEAQKAKGRKSWKYQNTILRRDVLPEIGDIKGNDLTRADIKAMLRKITDRPAPILANRAHDITRSMLNWALLDDDENEYRLESNVAEKIGRNIESSRERYLTTEELGAYWNALDHEDATKAAANRLCLLTAQRQANVLGMRRDQLWLDDTVWKIPRSTTKTRKPNKVPLSGAALEIIEHLLGKTDKDAPWLFPSQKRDGPISTTSRWHRDVHVAACARAGIEGYTLHDHRHTFATHADAMGVPRLVWDGILGHAQASMAELYSGFDFDQQRRDCMEKWAQRIAVAAGDNVVSLDGRRGKSA